MSKIAKPAALQVPSNIDGELRAFLEAAKQRLELIDGDVRSPLDRIPTLKELQDANLIKVTVKNNYATFTGDVSNLTASAAASLTAVTTDGATNPTTGTGGGGSTGGGNVVIDLTPPPAPTNLATSSFFGAVFLTFGGWGGTAAFTEIWRSTINDRNSATMIGSGGNAQYVDYVDVVQTYYYWVRFVSLAGIEGDFNAINGTPGTPADDRTLIGIVADLTALNALTGNFEGRVVFVQSEGKLYRYTNGAWTAEVPIVDISGIFGGGNLVRNSSFENDWTYWTRTDFGRNTYSIDTSTYFHDSKSAKIQVLATDGVGEGHSYGLWQSIPTFNNGSFVLSAYLKGANSAPLYIRAIREVNNANLYGVSGQDVSYEQIAGSDWTRLQVRLAPYPSGNTTGVQIRVGMNLPTNTNMAVNIDSVQLEPGDVATAYAPLGYEVVFGSITESELATALGNRINLIDDPTTGLATKVSDLETTYGSTASAAASAAAAAASEAAALLAQQGAETAEDNAVIEATNASTHAGNAATSASNASTSASQASTSASNASASAASAATSQSAAATSATNAGNSASAAATSESNAATSATNASQSATSANNSATSASTSASNAATSASQASTSATNASGSASAASTSAAAAASSQTAASGSASAASVSANNAATSATNASNSATAAASTYNLVQAVATGWDVGEVWNFDAGLESWTAVNATLSVASGIVTVNATTSDPQFISPSISLIGGTYRNVRMRVKRTSGTGWDGNIYYTTSGHGISGSFRKNIADTTAIGEWRVLDWDMENLTVGGTDWINNTITSFRIDLGVSSTDDFQIDWVTIGRVSPQDYYAAIENEAAVRASADGTINARYTIKIDANGYVSGYGLIVDANDATPTSEFRIRTDKFFISSPSGPGITPVTPFAVITTPQTINGVSVPVGVYIDGAKIMNGTIANAQIGNAQINNAKISDLSADKITAGFINAARIDANTITGAMINANDLGAIKATLGDVSAGTINLSTSGHLRSGQTAYDTGSGFWIGTESLYPKFSIGDPSNNRYLRYDGSTGVLQVSAIQIQNGFLTNSVLGPSAARISTSNAGHTAPFFVFDTASTRGTNQTTRSCTIGPFYAPDYSIGGSIGYNRKRFAFRSQDVFLQLQASGGSTGQGQGTLSVRYMVNGVWGTLSSIKTLTGLDFQNANTAFSTIRYTTLAANNWEQMELQFEVVNNCLSIQMTTFIQNTEESANAAGNNLESTGTSPSGTSPTPPTWSWDNTWTDDPYRL